MTRHGSRGTPSVDADRVYGMSGRGDLVCAQVSDGKVLWKKTMSELGGRVPKWGFTESVLVDGDNVICTPGGPKGAIAALDKKPAACAGDRRISPIRAIIPPSSRLPTTVSANTFSSPKKL